MACGLTDEGHKPIETAHDDEEGRQRAIEKYCKSVTVLSAVKA